MNLVCLTEENFVGTSLIRKIFSNNFFKQIFDGFSQKQKGFFLPEVYEIFWGSMKCNCVCCLLGANF